MTDRERLIEIVKNSLSAYGKEARVDCKPQDFIADFLIANGVIIPPCKVGDTVYWLDNEKVKQGEVFEISIHSDGILVHTDIQFCLEVENVSLTREEAEKVLKERETE